MKRFWRYKLRGYRAWLISRGADEYGRRTLVILTPFGWLVWAYKTCRCAECDWVRAETAHHEREYDNNPAYRAEIDAEMTE